MSDRIFVSGGSESIDWFIDRGGKILATEEFNNGVQRIWGRLLDRRNLIHESGAEVPILGSIGISPDGQSVIVSAIPQGSDFGAYYELDLFDGSIGEPLYHRGGSDIERPLMDINRVVYGVEYSGFLPRYEFHDAALTERVRAIQSTLESTASYLVDWTPDFSHLVFRLSGGITSGAYVIVGPDSPKPKLLAFIREGIPAEAVAPTSVIEYEARDGLKIPALVTARVDVQADGKAPLIVLPHGGPSSYDRYEFDWLAQYFAGRGMVVLQPQFRGSLGFGSALSRAGVGEFGARMSTDLDDGVQHLIDEGLVDQSRVCMVGHSYGGYAALAAGAFSTFDYKCLVAIAGVSDWKRMKLTYSRMFQGDWSDFGDEMTERSLKDISPVNFAKQFRSSVLLIHGRNDTIVPYHQSTDMWRALRFRGKSVELVRLKSEDHYLSGYETRLEALRAIESFLDENL